MVGIYKITNLLTQDCYVGKSKHVEKRWKEHFCKGYGAIHSKSFQEDIDKYGASGFSFELIEECGVPELHERERFWIGKLNPSYNTVRLGHPVSSETRKKISESLTGRKQPRELVEKRKAALKEYRKTHPQTNAGHRKRVAIESPLHVGGIAEFESVKALAEYLKAPSSSVTKALKRCGKIRGKKVWYVV